MATIDVTALGELLIDFTESGFSPGGNQLLEVNPGGAPCNVLSMLQNLGRKTAFIGKVGNDTFGHYLQDTIECIGINAENLILDRKAHTTLTFVHTLTGGEREFTFCRNPGADMMLAKEDIKPTLITGAKVFHFGTLSMTHEACREATLFALHLARNSGCIISFDPNLRPPLWNSLDEALEQIKVGLAWCNVLKISDDELQFVTGETDICQGVKMLKQHFDIPLICVTCGSNGSYAFYKETVVYKEAFKQNTIETTGAGDTFCACMINSVLEYGIDNMNAERLEGMLTFANAAASIVTTKKGALKAMPAVSEVLELIKRTKGENNEKDS